MTLNTPVFHGHGSSTRRPGLSASMNFSLVIDIARRGLAEPGPVRFRCGGEAQSPCVLLLTCAHKSCGA